MLQQLPYFRVLILASILCFMCASSSVLAQKLDWRYTDGNFVDWSDDKHGLGNLVKHGNTVLAIDLDLGLLRSTNNGNTWSRVYSSLYPQFSALASNGKICIGFQGDTPVWSDNDGETWQKGQVLNTEDKLYSSDNIILDMKDSIGIMIVKDPYAQKQPAACYISTNSGKTWQRKERGIIPLDKVTGTASLGDIMLVYGKDFNGNGVILYNTYENYIKNFPVFWREFTRLPVAGTVDNVRIYNNIISTNVQRDIFFSLDTGKTWRAAEAHWGSVSFVLPYPVSDEIRNGISGLPINVVGIWPPVQDMRFDSHGTFFILTDNLIFSSIDTGRSWQLINSYMWRRRFSSASTSLLVQDSSIFISTILSEIYRCRIDGEKFEELLCGSLQAYKSRSSAFYWFKRCNNEISPLSTIGSGRKTYFAGGIDGIYRSEDAWLWRRVYPKMYNWTINEQIDGNEFIRIFSDSYFTNPEGGYCISSIAGEKNNILALTNEGHTLHSSDNGENWEYNKNPPPFGNQQANLIYLNGVFFAYSKTQLYRSFNNGTSWESLTAPTAIKILIENGIAMFAATSNGILRSLDKGATWHQLQSFQGKDIQILYAESTTIYAATNEEVQVSRDNGISWQVLTLSLTNETITSLTALQNMILVGTNKRLLTSFDNGTTWQVDKQAPLQSVRSLATNGSSILAIAKKDNSSWEEVFRSNIPIVISSKTSDVINVTIAPNPTNGVVTIGWKQPQSSYVTVDIYDILGRKVAGFNETYLVNANQNDTNIFSWDTSFVSQGSYLYRLIIDGKIASGIINVVR